MYNNPVQSENGEKGEYLNNQNEFDDDNYHEQYSHKANVPSNGSSSNNSYYGRKANFKNTFYRNHAIKKF